MQKALITLALVIAITEILIMLLLEVTALDRTGYWLPAYFDALIISLAAISAVKAMLDRSQVAIRGDNTSESIQIKIGVIVFGLKALVMLTLAVFTPTLVGWQAALFGTIILTLGGSLLIYRLALEPSPEFATETSPHKRVLDTTVATNVLGYAFLMTLLLMILITTYEQQYQKRELEVANHEIRQLEFIRVSFLEQLNNAALDLLILASQSDLQELLAGNRSSLSELEMDYLNIAQIKEYYDQIRLVGNDGLEVIRIQNDKGHSIIIPADKLQNKQSRYYFQEGARLFPGEIYISALDLNIENGEVVHPFKPMIRLVTPVADKNKQIHGFIILNLNGNRLLDKIKEAEFTTVGRLMLLNKEGYWLYGGDSGSQWDFMFKDKLQPGFPLKYHEAWSHLQTMQTEMFETSQGSFIIKKIEFDTDRILNVHASAHSHKTTEPHWPTWNLVSHIASSFISEQMQDTRQLMTMLYIAVLVMSAIGIALLTRAMLKRRDIELQIRQLAFYDPLTGLVNRRLFQEILDLEISHAQRKKDVLALMCLDLDKFKPINDELGHDAGDAVLQEVANRLRTVIRETDTIARLGGDEFAIILPDSSGEWKLSMIAQRIIDVINKPFHTYGDTRQLGVSIGIDLLSNTEKHPEKLIHRADIAMYQAKKSGRNCYRYE